MYGSLLPPEEVKAANEYRARWSHLSPENEAALQRGPLIEPFSLHPEKGSDGRYGTVSQTAVLLCASEGCAYYAYRTLHDGAPPAPWAWQRVSLPAAASGQSPPTPAVEAPPFASATALDAEARRALSAEGVRSYFAGRLGDCWLTWVHLGRLSVDAWTTFWVQGVA